MDYNEFLESKKLKLQHYGFDVPEIQLNHNLFPFQKAIVRWAIKKGKAAIFANCGLGKTIMQLEWANQIHIKTGQDILILAPLAVSAQTEREGAKFGIGVTICRESKDVKPGINITNYERLDKFDPSSFVGIVLDESSILKDFSSATRNLIINKFKSTPYKLACTATPAPNDYMELGNHAEFLNVMSRVEMLAMFFIHDGSDTAKWRLKGHVKDNLFWQWMRQWAIMITNPSDIGFSDDGFILPELTFHEHIVEVENTDGTLFVEEARGLLGRRRARKDSLDVRVDKAADLVTGNDQWLVWCDLNSESDLLSKSIQNSIEVKGADSVQHKETSLLGFANGDIHCLVIKASIAGHGMNFQNCHNMIFVGLSDSYEALYQAIRRCWRFGQTKPVNVHIVMSEKEGSILKNIKRKEIDFMDMIENMVRNTSAISTIELQDQHEQAEEYAEQAYGGKSWVLINGDSIEVSRKTESNSIDYTIFSPPFSSLYTYSDSVRDMGNSKAEEFTIHFRLLIEQMFRTTKPGRLVSIHCMDIPAMKERDGYIGLKDFSGDIIRMMQDVGFVYHSRCTIWKDPLIEATRTKALGLMHKQIMKDSSRCRNGLPDYLITFMKPGENQNLISHPDGFTRFIGLKTEDPQISGIEYSHHVWRKYASPVWMDINQTNTLNKNLAREDKDERHIAPLQLDVIGRCIEMWSNPGDLVCSWFAGIGSEGYMALEMGRRFFGVELKKSYAEVAVRNLTWVEDESQKQLPLFGGI